MLLMNVLQENLSEDQACVSGRVDKLTVCDTHATDQIWGKISGKYIYQNRRKYS
jgi:hypothetical protein